MILRRELSTLFSYQDRRASISRAMARPATAWAERENPRDIVTKD